MRRRSRAGGEPAKAPRRKTAARKSRITPKAVRPRSSSAAREETKVARLIRERDDALQQQRATTDVLKVISRSTFDLQTVLNTLVESAARLCDADSAGLHRPQGDNYPLIASYGFSPEFEEFLRTHPVVPRHETVLGRAVMERRAIHVHDIQNDSQYRFAAQAAKVGGFRTMLGVPLLREGIPIGVIVLTRKLARPFSEKQIELVTTFGDQAVIAIENTRLFEAEQQRTQELTESLEQQSATSKVLDVISRSAFDLKAVFEAVAESSVRLCGAHRAFIFRFDGDLLRCAVAYNTKVSQAVNSTLELETVLSTIVANAVQLSGTEAGAIYVFNDEQREFRLRATYGMDRELIDTLAHADMSINEPNIALILAERGVIQVADLRDEAPNEINDITLRAGFRARLVAPLMRGEDVVGLLVVRRRAPGTFPQNTIDLIKTFAAQSAVAIENARLFQSVPHDGELPAARRHLLYA